MVRGLRTHRALEEAAFRLFSERGYEATTVDDIAAAAGVTTRTFFHHFAAKHDVLGVGGVENLEHAIRAIRRHVRGEPVEGQVCAAVVDFFATRGSTTERVRQRGDLRRRDPDAETAVRKSVLSWPGAIAEVLAEVGGHDQPGAHEYVWAAIIVEIVLTVEREWAEAPGEASLVEASRRICEGTLERLRHASLG